MNRIRGKAYVIKYKGKARVINDNRLVYGYDIGNTPRENAERGYILLCHEYPKDKDHFTIHETRIKAGDILVPYMMGDKWNYI